MPVGNTRINTFHENEAEAHSPREATKFRPNFDQDLRRQPFVGGLYFFTQLFTSQDEVLTLMNKMFKAA